MKDNSRRTTKRPRFGLSSTQHHLHSVDEGAAHKPLCAKGQPVPRHVVPDICFIAVGAWRPSA